MRPVAALASLLALVAVASGLRAGVPASAVIRRSLLAGAGGAALGLVLAAAWDRRPLPKGPEGKTTVAPPGGRG